MTNAGRIATIHQHVSEMPAPVVADAFGHHPVTTAKIATQAGVTWSRYASRDHSNWRQLNTRAHQSVCLGVPIRGTRHDAALDAFRSVQDYQGTQRTTDLAAEVATGSNPFEFFAALRVGGYDHMSFGGGPAETWLANGRGSWACHTSNADGTHSVRQGGPTRLWDVIEDAHGEWGQLGQPVRERFWLSVRSRRDAHGVA